MDIIDEIRNALVRKVESTVQYFDQSGNSILDVLSDKGASGEYRTYNILTGMLLPEETRFVLNCYVETEKGNSTEIDLIMIHPTGIYVFESKNYSGYIFGSSSQQTWTQTLNAGRRGIEKHKFLNPVIQNRYHIKYLKSFIEYAKAEFYSYIIFSDRCSFKKLEITGSERVIHRNALKPVLYKDLLSKTDVLTAEEITDIYNKLSPLSHRTCDDRKRHVDEIKAAASERQEKIDSGICPVCGGRLVLRTASKGQYAGKQFYGCSNYPGCRFIKNI